MLIFEPVGCFIVNPDRKATDKDQVNRMANSLIAYGLITPLVCGKKVAGVRMIIDGVLRFRAMKQLGWQKIPAIVQTPTKNNDMEYAIIIHRCFANEDFLLEYAFLDEVERQDEYLYSKRWYSPKQFLEEALEANLLDTITIQPSCGDQTRLIFKKGTIIK